MIVFDNVKIFTDNIEPEALQMVHNMSAILKDRTIRVMPDCHVGKGAVIGTTFTDGDIICPSHVGVDIGCSVSTYITDKPINPEEYTLIEHRIRKEIPFGMDINEHTQIDYKDFYKYMRNQLSGVGLIGTFDEEAVSDICQAIGMDEGRFYKSLGTVGGGNHFIEIGVTSDGRYAITIHTGSRNFGAKVCNFWERYANSRKIDKELEKQLIAEAKRNTVDKHKLPEIIKEIKAKLRDDNLPMGYLKGAAKNHYMYDAAVAQFYASYNHKVIADKIVKIIGCRITMTIMSRHNYIDFIDGVIRKGAIRAVQGQLMVIPFNMRDGIGIFEGKSNPDWNYSAPHGSGRAKSRAKAKETISLVEFKKQMEGIYSTSVCKETLDEAPDAYKDTQEILDLIEPTCRLVVFIKPVINLKATNGDGEI